MPTVQDLRPNRSYYMTDFGVCSKKGRKISALSVISGVLTKLKLEMSFSSQPSANAKESTLKRNGAYEGEICSKKNKTKVIFVLGATATGKTKISIALASYLGGEIINSDKIQVYKGLDIATNKATESERQGIPHHLFSFIDDPDYDFTIQDFCRHVHMSIDSIIGNGHIPIIVGGSNSYVEALVEDPSFKAKYNSCFLWMDVKLPTLYDHSEKRVDRMCDIGLVEEIREVFDRNRKDFSRGLWRTIGVPEMAEFFQIEMNKNVDENTKKMLLEEAIKEIKLNTRKLVNSQSGKIYKLKKELGWKLHRIDATSVYENSGGARERVWMKVVLNPCFRIVLNFLKNVKDDSEKEVITPMSKT